MQDRFKKGRTVLTENLLATVVGQNILKCDFATSLKTFTIEQYHFEAKSSDRILSPPQISLNVDGEIANNVMERFTRARKTIQGTFTAQSPDASITNFQELPLETYYNQEDDINNEENRQFRIGFALVMDDGVQQTKERIFKHFRHCSERSGAKYSCHKQSGRPSDIWRLLSRLIRTFIIIEERQRKLKLGKLYYYPKVELSLRKVKITPFSFVESQALRRLQNINFGRDIIAGYVSLSKQDNNSYKFLLLTPQEFQAKPTLLVGVYVAGKLGGQIKQDSLLWTIIMEYLTNPVAAINNRRLSIRGERTGLLFLFQQNNKNSNFQFQVPSNARWAMTSSIDACITFPSELYFSTRQIIMQQQKQQSEVGSVHSRQQFMGGQQGPPDSFSSRSFDERDHEISRLRKQLQVYKNLCGELREVIASLSGGYQNAVPYSMMHMPMPMMNNYQNGIHLVQDPSFLYFNDGRRPTESEPYFGKKTSSASTPNEPLTYSKQFRVKDSKNISFAQENSYEQEMPIGSLLPNLEESQFISPQFKQTAVGKNQRQVRGFEQRGNKIETAVLQQKSIKQAVYYPEGAKKNQSPKQIKTKQRFTNKIVTPDKTSPRIQPSSDSAKKQKQESEKQIPIKTMVSRVDIKQSEFQKKQQTFEVKPRIADSKEGGQRNKAFAEIISKQNQIHKKYLVQEPEVQVRTPDTMKRGTPISLKSKQSSPRVEIKSKQILDIESDEDEQLQQITQRYRKK